MSYIFTNVRVTLARLSDIQSNLEIPVTDEFHMVDETIVLTKPNKDTFNRLACQQPGSTVAFDSCCYIKLEKHKLNYIAEGKMRISLDKLVYSFLEVKLQRL